MLAAGDDTTTLEHGLSEDATGVVLDSAVRADTYDLKRRTTTTLALQIPSDAATLLPAGRGWLVTAPDGTEYWYPPGASRAAQRIADHTSWVTTAATNAAGTVLVTPAPDLRLVVSDLIGGKWQRREVLTGGGSNVLAVAVDRSGSRAFSASDDGTVTAWDLTGDGGFGARIRTPYVAGLDPLRLIVLGDPTPAGRSGDWLVPVQRWGGPDTQGPVYGMFIDHRTLRAVGAVRASDRPPLGWPNETATTSPDGRLAAVTTMYSTAIVDLDTRRVVHRVTLPDVPSSIATNGSVATDAPEPVGATAWSADGRRLFLATLGARGRRAARVGRGGRHPDLESTRQDDAARRRTDGRGQPRRRRPRGRAHRRRRRARRHRRLPGPAPAARRRRRDRHRLLRRRRPRRRDRDHPPPRRLGRPHRDAPSSPRRRRSPASAPACAGFRIRTRSSTAATTGRPSPSTPTTAAKSGSACRSTRTQAPATSTSHR